MDGVPVLGSGNYPPLARPAGRAGFPKKRLGPPESSSPFVCFVLQSNGGASLAKVSEAAGPIKLETRQFGRWRQLARWLDQKIKKCHKLLPVFFWQRFKFVNNDPVTHGTILPRAADMGKPVFGQAKIQGQTRASRSAPWMEPLARCIKIPTAIPVDQIVSGLQNCPIVGVIIVDVIFGAYPACQAANLGRLTHCVAGEKQRMRCHLWQPFCFEQQLLAHSLKPDNRQFFR